MKKKTALILIMGLTVLFSSCSYAIKNNAIDESETNDGIINIPTWIQGSYSTIVWDEGDLEGSNIKFTSDSVIFNDATTSKSLDYVSSSYTGTGDDREFNLCKSGIYDEEDITIYYKFSYYRENEIKYTKTINDVSSPATTLYKDSSGATEIPTHIRTPNWLQGSFSYSDFLTVEITPDSVILSNSNNIDNPVIDFNEYATGNMVTYYYINNSMGEMLYGISLRGSYEGQFFYQNFKFKKQLDNSIGIGSLYANGAYITWDDRYVTLNRIGEASIGTDADEIIIPPDWIQGTYIYTDDTAVTRSIEFTDNNITVTNILGQPDDIWDFSGLFYRKNFAAGSGDDRLYNCSSRLNTASGTYAATTELNCKYIDDSSIFVEYSVGSSDFYLTYTKVVE